MLEYFGVLLILVSLSITAWWVIGENPHKKWAFAICLAAIFSGAFLILQERVTELTVENIGTIKSAAKQASADAKAITDLKKRVEAQSATIDLIAREAANGKQLISDLSEKNSMAEKKLSELDVSISKGNIAVQELQLYTHFNSTVLAAQNDDRRAYDQLLAWSSDNAFSLKKFASQAAQTLIDQHNPAMVRGGFKVPWQQGVDPNKLTIIELWKAYKSAPTHIRIGILEFVWEKRNDLSKRERLQFLVDVLRTDESLRVVEYAGRYFAQGTGDRFKPIAIKQHLEWWSENKDTIE